MHFQRTVTPWMLEQVINDPSVRPTAQPGTNHYLTADDVLADLRNVCYIGPAGAILFVWLGDGTYDGHVFLPEGSRGRLGLAFGKTALRALFTVENVRRVVCRVPWGLPAARWYVRRLGFVSRGRHPGADVEMFVMETFNG